MTRPDIIFCDIDGTLLHGSQKEIAPAVFDEIRRLAALGVRFCPASGRQYSSLRHLFAPVADEICYLCENGAILYGAGSPGPVLYKSVVEPETALKLCREILADPRCEILISGADVSYLLTDNEAYRDHLRFFVGNKVQQVERLEDIPEAMIKISLYVAAGSEVLRQVRAEFAPRWEHCFNADIASDHWLDFTVTNKGDGTRTMCRLLGADPANAMAIGDNFNDVPMLDAVGMPVLMENGQDALKARYPVRCSAVEELLRQIV